MHPHLIKPQPITLEIKILKRQKRRVQGENDKILTLGWQKDTVCSASKVHVTAWKKNS